ncbi:hypothetical protein FGG08_007140 [Glutinoglossum americanum]|uniref:UDP-galactose transporter homolog 1 n=1 Tax=Glutinoglossum americanum TaxID=1670608 RepID=A0A9P8KWS0_9PEZI|nr:hypothetical protein FGG08_007140 [Glutinoglossum americanum]
MARHKQPPIHRQNSDLVASARGDSVANGGVVRRGGSAVGRRQSNGAVADGGMRSSGKTAEKKAGVVELVVCVGGIYGSFLTWALLQERITTTTYATPGGERERFTFSLVLNTIQSLLAFLVGMLYLHLSTPARVATPALFPTASLLPPLLLISVTSSLASPFGYAALKHIDYITFILAKACKLLPVMFLHLTIFRTRYPVYKYAVVAAVTGGVAVFTLHHPAAAGKGGKGGGGEARSGLWGLLLLGINLLFDGLTNSTQDYIFQAYRPYSGVQMMCAQNLLNTLLTGLYLVAQPYLGATGVGEWVGVGSGSEVGEAVAFMGRHPGVGWDVLGFAACGAVGQVFIFSTLSHFSSLLLVTVTVTRKMLTMILSVVWFGHHLSPMQWLGVGLVFSGVGAEGVGQRREKKQKEEAKRRAEVEGKKEL